jgi:hypothetical protein
MQSIQSLFDAITLKQATGGVRTWIIFAIIVAAVIAEQVLKYDIPGINAGWELIAVALGLKTAADHKV